MTRPAAVLSAALVAAALALAAAGCGGEGDPEGASAEGDTASAAEGAATDSAAAGAASGAASGDSAASADSAGDSRPLRARILRIVNPRGQAVVVTASAGLEAVVLDTVPAGDSVEVNVESRAPRVGLQALVEGRQVGADSLDLTGTEATRWLVPPGGGVSSRPAPGRRSPRRWR